MDRLPRRGLFFFFFSCETSSAMVSARAQRLQHAEWVLGDGSRSPGLAVFRILALLAPGAKSAKKAKQTDLLTSLAVGRPRFRRLVFKLAFLAFFCGREKQDGARDVTMSQVAVCEMRLTDCFSCLADQGWRQWQRFRKALFAQEQVAGSVGRALC